MNCSRCGGPLLSDNDIGELVCFNCGCRLYDGYPAHPPMPEDKALAEFDLLPYIEQVRILRAKRKQAAAGYKRQRRQSLTKA